MTEEIATYTAGDYEYAWPPYNAQQPAPTPRPWPPTLTERIERLEQELGVMVAQVRHLECIVHKYINRGEEGQG